MYVLVFGRWETRRGSYERRPPFVVVVQEVAASSPEVSSQNDAFSTEMLETSFIQISVFLP